jgi:hypothetical protein
MVYIALKFLHVIGATVLLGTGAGIAFFMLMAHRDGRPAVVAAVARIVVIGDFLFTATAVVAQPVTGVLLAYLVGYSLLDGWIVLSILLYTSPARSGYPSSGCRCACATWLGPPRQSRARHCRPGITGCSGPGSPSAFPPSARSLAFTG